jgi:predicted ABC-type ATPase
LESGGKKIVILAGPNGAGKTTFAREFLPNEANCPIFVNADLIAAGLSPFDPEAAAFRAGRLMLEEIAHHAAAGRSFAFETTLSGLTYARMIPRWRKVGYTVKLIFLSLNSPEDAIDRVKLRVLQGGHDVPPDVIRRRFSAGLRNFKNIYQPLVDYWRWVDNSKDPARLLEEGSNP